MSSPEDVLNRFLLICNDNTNSTENASALAAFFADGEGAVIDKDGKVHYGRGNLISLFEKRDFIIGTCTRMTQVHGTVGLVNTAAGIECVLVPSSGWPVILHVTFNFQGKILVLKIQEASYVEAVVSNIAASVWKFIKYVSN